MSGQHCDGVRPVIHLTGQVLENQPPEEAINQALILGFFTSSTVPL